MNKYQQRFREGVVDIIAKLMTDKKLKDVLSKIEKDPETKKAVQNLKKATDDLKPAMDAFMKKNPNSRLAQMLKDKGYAQDGR